MPPRRYPWCEQKQKLLVNVFYRTRYYDLCLSEYTIPSEAPTVGNTTTQNDNCKIRGYCSGDDGLRVFWVVRSYPVAYPGILSREVGGGGSTNSVEDREQGSGGGSPLVRGSGGSCNLVQEISFYIVKSS